MPPPLNFTAYDELPYPSSPYFQTHPDRLATVATLLGMQPANPDQCRVLELGCASGGNLIPMAVASPDSRFVGIDLSGNQIAEGQIRIQKLGLKNIELQPLNILEVDDRWGEFDFIMAHGVFSWVPSSVQNGILSIYARLLAPNGVGYISYNTYPGWRMRGMIRDMMCHHDQSFRDQPPLERVAQARKLLDFLTRSVPDANAPYGLLLKEHLELLRNCSDSYLFHEHLEEINEPVYFSDFCERLANHGLRYLGESEFNLMVAGTSFPPEVREVLDEMAPSLIAKEQYMDFLRNRTFRQSLVCHENMRPNYEVRAEKLTAFHVASRMRPQSATPDLKSETPEEFTAGGVLTLTTSKPVVKQALAYLGEMWPQAIAFDTLLTRARQRLDPANSDADHAHEDSQALSRALLTAYASSNNSLVELSLRPSAFVIEVSDRPLASPLARLQAESTHLVTNMRHQLVNLTKFDRHLLPLLDGTRNRAELIEELLQKHARGDIQFLQDDTPVTDADRARQILEEVLNQQLPKLAQAALLLK